MQICRSFKVAVIGGGISGAVFVSKLSKLSAYTSVHLFDQGRGCGGRTSTRHDKGFEFDHGCQFLRSDTVEMKAITSEWLSTGLISSWIGNHDGSGDFFGLPGMVPVYVSAKGGIHNIPNSLIQDATLEPNFQVFQGVRVEGLRRSDKGKWELLGKGGRSAYHDTPEAEAHAQSSTLLHEHDGYDIVVLTDLSSSFGGWHRASAGVPEDFSKTVRERAGARVPLFSCMVAFKDALNIPDSSITYDNTSSSSVWFAARTNSKPGFKDMQESWTIISTPEYAIQKIIETPMQDPVSGAFIPQSPDYLLTVPAPELCNEFLRLVGFDTNREVSYINAQRWGSALPAHRHLANDINSLTRKIVSGVAYDTGSSALAPTTLCGTHPQAFVSDDALGLYQIGDMVSNYTPGFEGAVLSAVEAATHITGLIKSAVE